MLTKLPLLAQIIIILFVALVTSLLTNFLLIKLQNKRKLYQPVREELSNFHKDKLTTPTLGGIGIFLGIIVSLLISDISLFTHKKIVSYLILISIFFLIGFVDDFLKVIKRDYHGVKDSIRFILEIIVSMLFLKQLGYQFVDFQRISLFSINLFVGIAAIVLSCFVVVGSANAMNLSDGLDGLATCLFIIAIMPFTIYAFKIGNYALGKILIASFGACIGFVIFNIHPSKIFMGDCGSLLLGAILGGGSIILHQEMMLLIAGLLLIFETLSVIIQVIYYKITKRRVFLMAPFHHHLELKGYSEEKVVLLFIIIGYILSFITCLVMI